MASNSAGVGSGLPYQGDSSGLYLTTDGTTASWASVGGGGGVDTIGTFSTTGITNGASISGTTLTLGPADGTKPGLLKALGNVGSTPAAAGASLGTDGTLTLQPADDTHPGVVTTGAQTWAGVKTFSGTGTMAVDGGNLTGAPDSDAAGHAAFVLDTTTTLAGGADVLHVNIHGFNLFKINAAGGATFYASGSLTTPANVYMVGTAVLDMATGGSAGSSIKMKSADGTTFTLTVSNAGALVIT